MSTVLREALALSVRERLQLIEEVWDSLAATPEAIPVTPAQRKEVARRRRAHARNPAAVRSWAEVRGELDVASGQPSRFIFEDSSRTDSGRRVHVSDRSGHAERLGRWTSMPLWRLRPDRAMQQAGFVGCKVTTDRR